jgi:hypothetical protein
MEGVNVMKRKPFFEEKIEEVKKYCLQNDLSFDILFSGGVCYNTEQANFQYLDKNKPTNSDVTIGGGGIPPVVLRVFNEMTGLRFEQTDYTYLIR